MAQEMPLERVPPNSAEAEAGVIGSILVDPDCVGSVVQILSVDDFYSRANRRVYQAALTLFDKSKPTDVLLVSEHLRAQGEIESVGGSDYVVQLAAGVPSAANAEHYAEIVRDLAMRRRLISACGEIVQQSFEGGSETPELLDAAEHRVFEIAERSSTRQARHVGEIYVDVFKYIDSLQDTEGVLTGVATPYTDLNELTGGLQDGELIILASRPSMGKTSLLLNIINHVGVEEKKPVVLFSMEMNDRQVAQNMLCMRSRVDSHKLRRGLVAQGQYGHLRAAVGSLADAPIYIDDSPSLGILELRAKARRLASQHDIAMLCVDYLQLMTGRSRESRQVEISEISRGLKAIARELSIPVLAACQLNRAVEVREDHRPRMSDLRESGALEQDADVVLLLHRPWYYYSRERMASNPDDERLAEIHIAKQRNGPAGRTVKLNFESGFMRFDDRISPRGLQSGPEEGGDEYGGF